MESDVEHSLDDAFIGGTVEQPRRPRWPWAVIAVFLLMIGLTVAAWNVSLPYFAMSPGPLYDVADFVILGEGEPEQSDGDLYMLTVVLQEVNIFEYALGALDPAIDLVERNRIRPDDISREEQREINLRSMDESKTTAILVALEELGYETTITGEGLEVASLLEGVPAAEVLEQGDVIIAVEGAEVRIAPDGIAEITSYEIGDTITLTIERGEEVLDVDVLLIEHTDFADRPMVGFMAETHNPSFELPIDVDIDSQNIGGPSAGLMYTLAVIDALNGTDLTQGWRIAGTGTIRSDGTIGAIGGIKQKVVAAQEAGAQYVFVPMSNFEDATTVVDDDVELVAVESLDEALEFLSNLPNA
ncbi:MAG: PDZ domain-containing protein [Acidimicrobiia bacterium]|nr:PDZ domain-containing protein [Acidimicrobiia bacterium]